MSPPEWCHRVLISWICAVIRFCRAVIPERKSVTYRINTIGMITLCRCVPSWISCASFSRRLAKRLMPDLGVVVIVELKALSGTKLKTWRGIPAMSVPNLVPRLQIEFPRTPTVKLICDMDSEVSCRGLFTLGTRLSARLIRNLWSWAQFPPKVRHHGVSGCLSFQIKGGRNNEVWWHWEKKLGHHCFDLPWGILE